MNADLKNYPENFANAEGQLREVDLHVLKPLEELMKDVEISDANKRKLALIHENILAMLPSINPSPEYPERYTPADRSFIDRVEKIIRENISNPELSVDFIRERMYMSQSALYRRMKGITGISLGDFLRVEQMRVAARMFEEGMSVGETANRLGYTDAAHFRNIFKEVHGRLPSEYIRQLKRPTFRE